MQAKEKFLNQPKHFWANVRSISEKHGYTNRRTKQVKVPTLKEMIRAMDKLNLGSAHIADQGNPTALGQDLLDYFSYRAEILNTTIRSHLMTVAQAKELFEQLHEKHCPACPLPMNTQKEEKRTNAYFTCIINILIEANAEGMPCNYDPRELTSVTFNNAPLRTLARRVDGAFPHTVNPIAVWEIKEYYYTTTFGSRVADGVYETLLDGMEIEDLREHEGIKVSHYLMVDGFKTWWQDGRSYLCRIIDMLHMGYVDEVLFGSEVAERLPIIVKEWVRKYGEMELT